MFCYVLFPVKGCSRQTTLSRIFMGIWYPGIFWKQTWKYWAIYFEATSLNNFCLKSVNCMCFRHTCCFCVRFAIIWLLINCQRMFASIKSCLFLTELLQRKHLSHNETSVFLPKFPFVICRVHQCLSHGPTVGSTWEVAVNLITGETVMGLDLQVIMNLSPQLAAPNGNKINQVNNFLRSGFIKKKKSYWYQWIFILI